jgi:O-antigen/teichoic acid export membrane protein
VWSSGLRYSAAALLSAAAAAAAAKLVAVHFGPAGTGLAANLQQLRQTGVTFGSLNGHAAIVQGGASLPAGERGLYLRTALLLVSGAGLAAAVIAGMSFSIPGLSCGTLAALVWISVLTAFVLAWRTAAGAWREVAALQLSAPVALALLVATAHSQGGGAPERAAVLLAAAAGASFLVAGGLAWRARQELRPAGRWWSGAQARRFVSLAGAMALSSACAAASLLLVRAGIAQTGGLRESGLFDAAWAVSMNTLSLILAGLQGSFLPALAGASRNERPALIDGALGYAAALALPAITALICLRPAVFGFLYAETYGEAVRVARWMAVGDYLRTAGWALALPMVASRHLRALGAADLAAYTTFGAGWWGLARVVKADEAAGMAFAALYAVHCGAAAAYARRAHGFAWSGSGARLWLVGTAVVAGATAANWNRTVADPGSAALWTGLALACVGGFALRALGSRWRGKAGCGWHGAC